MSARFDDNYLFHDKTKTLTNDALLTHMSSVILSAHFLRDGVLSVADVDTLAGRLHLGRRGMPPLEQIADELVAAGLWTPGDQEGAYTVHDYLQWNDSKVDVLKKRAKWAKAKREQRTTGDETEEETESPDESPPRTPPRTPLESQRVPVNRETGYRETGYRTTGISRRAKTAGKNGADVPNEAPAAPAGLIDQDHIAQKDDDAPPSKRELNVDPNLETFVLAREHGFHDNNAQRTIQTLQHMRINSGLSEERFLELVEDAVELTKKAQMAGQIRQRDEHGKMKSWPWCMTILEDLLRKEAGKPPKPKISIPLGSHHLAGLAAGISGFSLLDVLSDGKLDHIVRMCHLITAVVGGGGGAHV